MLGTIYCGTFVSDIESDAKFLLIVEKDAIFQKVLDSDFFKKFPPSILITVSHDKINLWPYI